MATIEIPSGLTVHSLALRAGDAQFGLHVSSDDGHCFGYLHADGSCHELRVTPDLATMIAQCDSIVRARDAAVFAAIGPVDVDADGRPCGGEQ